MAQARHLSGTGATGSDTLALERFPLSFFPKSTTAVNWERLPRQDLLYDMQLSVPELLPSARFLQREAGRQLFVAFITSLLLAVAVLVVAQVIPWNILLGGASLIALVAMVARTWNLRAMQLDTLWRGAYVLGGSIVLVAIACVVTLSYVGATLLASVLAIVAVAKFGKRPFRFCAEMTCAHPCLQPQESEKARQIPRPDYRVLIAVLGAVVVLPLISTSLAIGAVIVISLLKFRSRYRDIPLLPLLAAFGRYAWMPGGLLAPGSWPVRSSQARRASHLPQLFFPLYFALLLGTGFYMPSDLLFPWLLDGFAEISTDNAQAAMQAREQLWTQLQDHPERWVYFAFQSTIRTNGANGWLFVLPVALALILPPLVLVAVFDEPVRSLMRLESWVSGRARKDPRPEWQWYVDKLRTSLHRAPDPLVDDGASSKRQPTRFDLLEAEHLFMGVEPVEGFPILLQRKALAEHMYITGETGSGKTSVGIMPLLMQLIRGHEKLEEDGTRTTTDMPPIVVIDLKGDLALFNCVRAEAEKRREALGIEKDSPEEDYAFRFFSTVPGHRTHHFNPMRSLSAGKRSVMQLAEILMESLSLSHGEGYGRSYYSRRSRHVLQTILREGDGKIQSIEDLHKAVTLFARKHENRKVVQDTFELVATIDALSRYKQLATTETEAEQSLGIHMPTLLEKRQVAYFWLPAARESISVREIGKLALFCLLSAAIDRQDRGEKTRQCYLVIDEFQRLAGENFKIILEQARSFGIGAVLANQSAADLRTPTADLRTTIKTNTRIKQHFSVNGTEELRELSQLSGEELVHLNSWGLTLTQTAGSTARGGIRAVQSHTVQQDIRPRLTINELLANSDHPLESMLLISRGAGYAQFAGLPVPLRSAWAMSQGDYDRLNKKRWPEEEELQTVEVESDPKQIDAQAQQHTSEAQRAALLEQIDEMDASDDRVTR